MLDVAIVGATVIDGTGSAGVRTDVGIADGRIVALGVLDQPATEMVEGDGLCLIPGIVDAHTHYDAQLFWDPHATPSSWHGVTTVIGGNCGFTLAPLRPADGEYTRRMMAQVEGMPLAALEQGVPWNWETFGEYLDRLSGSTAVNAGFMVGHCALRRYVLGEDFAREATPREQQTMADLLAQSLGSGGLGLSTSRSSTHIDAEGNPVPSRWASEAEVLALCQTVGQFPGTSLEAITDGCLGRFNPDETELFARMSATARRPLNWNLLGIASSDPAKIDHQLQPAERARQLGGRVVALTMPVTADSNSSFLTFCGIWLIPGWRDILNVDVPERIRRLQDQATRTRMLELASTVDPGSPLRRLADFARYVIGDVYCPENEPYRGRLVGDLAAERQQDPFTVLVDIVAADDLRTVLWPLPADDAEADWQLRRQVWDSPDVLFGGSDAGAHLDRMLGSPYPTRFLADCLRGRRLMPLEQAVHLMTEAPARLFGLVDRGTIAVGARADLVLFDPDTVDAGPAHIVHDLPGRSKRLVADAVGMARVLVNGRTTLIAGQSTGTLAGTILRAGLDTGGTDTLAAV
jgi:N-acyl-D-aspartate/D-glutamate deacylase